MFIIANSDGCLTYRFDFRKSSSCIRFFDSRFGAEEVLRMLKVLSADDLNDAHVEEFFYPYSCPSWYQPIYRCIPDI